ncbi:MAG: hypothetical protein QXM68_04360 [Candidatus Aenigmatarchaeota archaeon]|nr:hypothetical protein [Candidatus Aenigmarchaeota archaeon]
MEYRISDAMSGLFYYFAHVKPENELKKPIPEEVGCLNVQISILDPDPYMRSLGLQNWGECVDFLKRKIEPWGLNILNPDKQYEQSVTLQLCLRYTPRNEDLYRFIKKHFEHKYPPHGVNLTWIIDTPWAPAQSSFFSPLPSETLIALKNLAQEHRFFVDTSHLSPLATNQIVGEIPDVMASHSNSETVLRILYGNRSRIPGTYVYGAQNLWDPTLERLAQKPNKFVGVFPFLPSIVPIYDVEWFKEDKTGFRGFAALLLHIIYISRFIGFDSIGLSADYVNTIFGVNPRTGKRWIEDYIPNIYPNEILGINRAFAEFLDSLDDPETISSILKFYEEYFDRIKLSPFERNLIMPKEEEILKIHEKREGIMGTNFVNFLKCIKGDKT